ncbi:MAG: M28 family peptidase [Myxococcales bacterium]|nr:M28 family peptidase [Myxococcales bacterium]
MRRRRWAVTGELRATLTVRAPAFALGVALGWPGLPPAEPGDAPPDRFSTARAMAHIQAWARAPRPSGSAQHQWVLTSIEAALLDLGFDVRRQTATGLTNLVVSAPGAGHEGVWLVAHSDTVPGAPGAADDGLGLGVLVETARALGPHPRLHLLVTDGEERGLLGAEAFLAGADAPAPQLLINVEARGTAGPAYMFQTAGASRPLLDAWQASGCAAQATSLARVVYEQMPNDTDFTRFRQAGWWGYDFALLHGAARYHTADDTPENLDARSVQQVGDCVLGLARAWLDAPHTGDGARVYAQAAGVTLVAPPWVIQLAGLPPLFALRRPDRWSHAVAGAGAWGLAVGVAGALGLALLFVLICAWPGFLDRPAEVEGALPVYIAALLLGTLTTAAAWWLAHRRFGHDAARGWSAAPIVLAAAFALAVPEAGYALVPGAFVAALAMRGHAKLAALAAIGSGLLLGPIGVAIFPALTTRLLPVLAALPVLLLPWLTPPPPTRSPAPPP